MGYADSKAKINKEFNSLSVNRSDLNYMNKQLNDLNTDVTMKHAKECSSGVNIQQLIDFSGATVAGDFTLRNVEMDSEAQVTFSCVNSSAVRSDVATEMVKSMLSNIENNVDSSVMAALETGAESSSSAGPMPSKASSKVKIDEKINITNINENTKNLQNIMENAVSTNFTHEEAQKCITAVQTKQGVDGRGMRVGGNVLIEDFNLSSAANVYSQCTQTSDVSSKITNQIAEEIGLSVVEDTTQKTEAESITTATSSAVAGMFDMTSLLMCCVCFIGCALLIGVVLTLTGEGEGDMFSSGGGRKLKRSKLR